VITWPGYCSLKTVIGSTCSPHIRALPKGVELGKPRQIALCSQDIPPGASHKELHFKNSFFQ
jgi:hypothetical protein